MKHTVIGFFLAAALSGCTSPVAPSEIGGATTEAASVNVTLDAPGATAATQQPANDGIVINHGEIVAGGSLSAPQGTVWLQGTRGFRVDGYTGQIGAFGWARCSDGCAPGSVVSIAAVWSDAWGGTVRLQGRTAPLGGAADDTAHIVFVVEGSVVAPPEGSAPTTVSVPFTLTRGLLNFPAPRGDFLNLPLSARRHGTATVFFEEAGGTDEGWNVRAVRYVLHP
jgi:hypothetical protein